MNKKLIFSLLVGGAVALTGCNKKISQFDSSYFSVNPNPLEVSGNNVPGTVTGKIPAKVFVKNAEVTVTPYLTVNGQEIASQPYTYQGEKVRGNNSVINYDQGGTMTIPVNYAYQSGMEDATLSLGFDVKQGDKQYVLPRVNVAKGVNTTANIVDASTTTPVIAPDKFQRVISEKYSADIKFLINQANIRDTELRSEGMQQFNQQLADASADSTRQIKEINIQSQASPEGGVEYNEKLAQKREENTSAYLNKHLQNENISFGELTAQFTAQDWEGFQRLVSESDIQDKELILSVLQMYDDPEVREKEIRNMSAIFDQLAIEILPQLRYSRLTATVDVIGKSDEQIQAAFETDPKSLTVDELLYCATLTDDNNKKIEIYQTAANIYGNDYRTFNNLGACQFINGDYTSAAANFKKALSLNSSCNEANVNLGLISMLNNENSKANEYLGNAGGIDAASEALGVYYLKTGDAKTAVKEFGDTKSNNAALAQILTKDYSKAKKTLASITSPDATTYYLMAVLGARTNNEQMVVSNLRQAAKLDSSLAAKALKDPEFTNFNLSSL